jgi:hypothetical protein
MASVGGGACNGDDFAIAHMLRHHLHNNDYDTLGKPLLKNKTGIRFRCCAIAKGSARDGSAGCMTPAG